MIGPHEGQELELMLNGKKPFAMFHDIAKSGYKSPEEIIPEKAFAPFVTAGQIIRGERIFESKKHPGEQIKYVCFARPDQSWRIDAFLWIKEEFFNASPLPRYVDDIIIGRLLGYGEQDIMDFLSPKK